MKLPLLVLVGLFCACARINYGAPDDDDEGTNDSGERLFAFTDGTIPPGIAFSRGSAATYVDGTGAFRIAAADEPRFVTAGTGSPALLVEGERHNVILNSRFEAALTSWELDNIAPSGVNVVAGGLLNEGGHHVELRRELGDPYQGIVQLVDTLAPEVHTLSFVARRIGACNMAVAVDGIGVGEPITLTPTPARYTFTFDPGTTDDVFIGLYCANGNPGDGWDLSHIQLEAGPIATSIIINDSVSGPARRAPDRLVAVVPESATPSVTFSGTVTAIADRTCLACLGTVAGQEPALVLEAAPSSPELGFVTYTAAIAEVRLDSNGNIGEPVKALASTDGFDLLLGRDGVVSSDDITQPAPTFDRLIVGTLSSDLPFDAVLHVERLSYGSRALDAATAAASSTH